MTAGMNLKGRVWRFYTPVDDDQGGAVPSGVVVYDNIYSRISALQPTIALLEQGLETPTIYNGLLQYPAFNITGTFEIFPNDQYEVTWPPINVHYGKFFKILGMQPQSYDDARKYYVVHMRRFVTAHGNHLQ